MVTISKNKEKGGIELAFPSKPADEVLAYIKSKGFGWSKYNKVWWRKFDTYIWKVIHEYFDQPIPEIIPEEPAAEPSGESLFHGVTANEFILLDITASLKSFARNEALKRAKLLDQKDSLKASLIKKRLMLKSGAINEMGRTVRKQIIAAGDYNSGAYYSGYDKFIAKHWATDEPVSPEEKPDTMQETTMYYKITTETLQSYLLFLKELRPYIVNGKVFSAGIGVDYMILTGDYDKHAAMHPSISTTDFDSIITDSKNIRSYSRLNAKPTPEKSWKGKWVTIDERIKHIENVLADDDPEEKSPDTSRPDFSDIIKGRDIEISMPNGEKRKAYFAITELDHIIASHNEDNFHSEPAYPKNASGNNINDRNYKDDLSAQKAVMDYARELEPERLITTSRTPSGTPIISKDGFVVSGNNRTMSLKLAAKNYPANYKEYVDFLISEIDAFGFSGYKVSSFEVGGSIKGYTFRNTNDQQDLGVVFTHPVLVRVDLDFPEYTTQELAKYNKDTKKAERPVDKAIKLSNILRENSRCAEIIAEITGEYETFTEFYANIVGQKKLAKTLIECNLLTEQEMPAYFSDTTFTETGKEFIENLLAALILDREALMATEQPGVKGIRQKLITSLPVLMKNATLPEGSLRGHINDAVIFQQIMKASGSEFTDFIRQANLYGTKYNRKTVYLNRLINQGKLVFKSCLEKYNASIIINQAPALFGEKPTVDDIFNQYIKKYVDSTEQRLIEKSELISRDDFKLSPEQKAIIQPEWDKMQDSFKKEDKAAELGNMAFEHGIKRIPIQDPELVKLIEGLQVGESSMILDAWTKAWDKANLAAPVTDSEAKEPIQMTEDEYVEDQIKHHGRSGRFSEQIRKEYREKVKQNTPIDQARAADEKHDAIHTEFLRFTNDEDPNDRFKIYLVDGNEVRKDHIEFTMGGHGYVYDYIPKDEIWIDENLKDKPEDMEATIKHEVFEVRKMRDEGLDYESAHELANAMEKEVRNNEPDDKIYTLEELRDIYSYKNGFNLSELELDNIVSGTVTPYVSIGKLRGTYPDFERDPKYKGVIIDSDYKWFVKVAEDQYKETANPYQNGQNEPESLYKVGDIVTSYWDKKGVSSSATPDDIHTIKRTGTIKKVTWQPERQKHSYQVDHDNGFLLAEDDILTKEPDEDIAEVRLKKLMLLRKFISVSQHEALSELMMGEEGEAGWEIIDRIGGIIETMPKTYETENIKSDDKIVYLHYFRGGSDFYIVEKDKEPIQYQAFGYSILNGDKINAEWGYISIVDLIRNNIELDFYWTPKKFSNIIDKEEKAEQPEPETNRAEFLESLHELDMWRYLPEPGGKGREYRKFILHPGNERAVTDLGIKESLRDTTRGGKPYTEAIISVRMGDEATKQAIEEAYQKNTGTDVTLNQPFKLPIVTHNGTDYFVDFKLQEIRDKNTAQSTKFTDIKSDELKAAIRFVRAESGPNVNMPGLDDRTKEKWEEIRDWVVKGGEIDIKQYSDDDLRLYAKKTAFGLGVYEGDITDAAVDRSRLISSFYMIVIGKHIYDCQDKEIQRIGEITNNIYTVLKYDQPIQFNCKDVSGNIKQMNFSKDKTGVEKGLPNIEESVSKTDISVTISDYKNEFDLNKGIEALLDKKWNDSVDKWSAAQLVFIKGYTGYGGLDDESMKAGVKLDVKSLFEYFTPDQVIEKMWGLAYKYGYKDGPVLEPSCGIGPFFDRRFVSNTIEKHGYEINKYSAKICKLLYPEAIINDGEDIKYFEQVFIKNNYTVRGNISPVHELVIGNPPYAAAEGEYMHRGEKTYSHAKSYIDYFIFRGLDLLKKDGLLIYIIGAEVAAGGKPWLDQGDSKCKQLIAAKGKLIDAYRLPSGVFARTDVTSDIVVFRRR